MTLLAVAYRVEEPLEDTETRFVKTNRAAMQLLGLTPEDVPGTIGMSLVAPDQNVQQIIQGGSQF